MEDILDKLQKSEGDICSIVDTVKAVVLELNNAPDSDRENLKRLSSQYLTTVQRVNEELNNLAKVCHQENFNLDSTNYSEELRRKINEILK